VDFRLTEHGCEFISRIIYDGFEVDKNLVANPAEHLTILQKSAGSLRQAVPNKFMQTKVIL